MAHFCPPPGAARTGYDIDGKLAPDSVGRMQIPSGSSRQIALWRGSDLWIKSSNPSVVPNGIFSREQGDLRIITLVGNNPGTAVIETGLGNAKWVSLRVDVVETSETVLL